MENRKGNRPVPSKLVSVSVSSYEKRRASTPNLEHFLPEITSNLVTMLLRSVEFFES